MVLVWIYSIISNIEYFSCTCLLFISYVEKCLFKSFVHFFKLGYLDYFAIEFKSSLWILKINPLSDIESAITLFYSIICLFIFSIDSILYRSLLVWYSPTCLFFLLFLELLVSYPKNNCQSHEAFLPCFIIVGVL